VKLLGRLARFAIQLAAAGLLSSSGSAYAQDLPVRPLTWAGGRVTLGGDASLTFSCSDAPTPGTCGEDTGFFNYSDYELSTLRMLRIDMKAAVRPSAHLALVGEVRSENGEGVHAYALYVGLRPWQDKAFEIEAGRVPPTFGAFAQRTYANDNILIGYPLSYQYLTSIRPDAVPANADELLAMRGRGWLAHYSLGNTTPDRGTPIDSAFRWDTGVAVRSKTSWAEVTASVTTGTLGNPLVADDNAGKQLSGRVAFHPVPGLIVGASGARGPFLTRDAARSAGMTSTNDSVQSALGADVEYSRDYYLLRVEAIRSDWTLPTINVPLTSLGITAEGRYRFTPRLYAAARYDHMGFSTIAGTTRVTSWDAPVTRAEAGGGYLVTRNLQLKSSVQLNQRDGGRVTHLMLWAAQAVFWF